MNRNTNIRLSADESAVSPVIGVILMVAITVILAAVIGAFVLGLGDGLTDTGIQASLSYDVDVDGSDNIAVTITHQGGDTIPAGAEFVGPVSTVAEEDSVTLAEDLAAGGSVVIADSEHATEESGINGFADFQESGGTVSIVVDDNVVGSFEVPNTESEP